MCPYQRRGLALGEPDRQQVSFKPFFLPLSLEPVAGGLVGVFPSSPFGPLWAEVSDSFQSLQNMSVIIINHSKTRKLHL